MPRGWNYYLRAKTMEPSVPRKYEQCVKITWHINNYSSSSSSPYPVLSSTYFTTASKTNKENGRRSSKCTTSTLSNTGYKQQCSSWYVTVVFVSKLPIRPCSSAAIPLLLILQRSTTSTTAINTSFALTPALAADPSCVRSITNDYWEHLTTTGDGSSGNQSTGSTSAPHIYQVRISCTAKRKYQHQHKRISYDCLQRRKCMCG